MRSGCKSSVLRSDYGSRRLPPKRMDEIPCSALLLIPVFEGTSLACINARVFCFSSQHIHSIRAEDGRMADADRCIHILGFRPPPRWTRVDERPLSCRLRHGQWSCCTLFFISRSWRVCFLSVARYPPIPPLPVAKLTHDAICCGWILFLFSSSFSSGLFQGSGMGWDGLEV
jgi:hypothetical protein